MEIKTQLLILKSQKGDADALNLLIQGAYPSIYQLSFRYFGNHDIASEITQQTMIQIYQQIQTLKDVNAWESWFYKIAINFCHQESKKQKNSKVISIHHQTEVQGFSQNDIRSNPSKKLESQEITQMIQKAIQKLPEEQRLVLIMKEYQGMKFREIAESLEISENTAKSRLYYALKALKKTLNDWNIHQEILNYVI